jgi:hypothetical protein
MRNDGTPGPHQPANVAARKQPTADKLEFAQGYFLFVLHVWITVSSTERPEIMSLKKKIYLRMSLRWITA